MDNVTHTLFGLTLARTRLGRTGRGATAALVLASNAPDVDIIAAARGIGSYLTWHRGPTHGALGVVGLGLVTAAVVWGVGRLMNPRDHAHAHDARTAQASFASLVLVSLIGVTGHILMDLPTSYGTRLLSPFNWQWFSADWLPIVDIYLLIALAAGLVFGRMSSEARRPNVAIVLVLMMANYGIRAAAHHEAVRLAPRLFGPTLPAPCHSETSNPLVGSWPTPVAPSAATARRCLNSVAAIPTFLSPFRWTVIAQVSDVYEVGDIDLLDQRFRGDASPAEVLWRLARHWPNTWTSTVFDAARTSTAQTFLGFSRFPVVRTTVGPDGVATVRWTDMRFVGVTQRPAQTPANPFSVAIRLGPGNEILQQGFSP